MKTFTIKPEHLKLLQKMYVDWEDAEFGAPSIDPKRPYGNSSVHEDMMEILGWLGKAQITIKDKAYPVDVDDMEIPDEVENELDKLHKETETALQICLTTQAFQLGTYVADDYRINWRKEEK